MINEIQNPLTLSKPLIKSMDSSLKRNSSRDKTPDDGTILHPTSPCDQDSASSLKSYLFKMPRDMSDPDPLILQSIDGDVPRDNHSLIDSSTIISSNSNPLYSHDTGNNFTGLNKDSYKKISNTFSTSETIPPHLNLIPPNLVIPEEYKWIFVHGGWTLIPSINFDKFYAHDPSPQKVSSDIPSNDELVDWGKMMIF